MTISNCTQGGPPGTPSPPKCLCPKLRQPPGWPPTAAAPAAPTQAPRAATSPHPPPPPGTSQKRLSIRRPPSPPAAKSTAPPSPQTPGSPTPPPLSQVPAPAWYSDCSCRCNPSPKFSPTQCYLQKYEPAGTAPSPAPSKHKLAAPPAPALTSFRTAAAPRISPQS